MNSLQFIKMYIDEWPIGYRECKLYSGGLVWFSVSGSPGYHNVDLSEHYTVDVIDNKTWTREQFEACDASSIKSVDTTVEQRGKNYGRFDNGAEIMQQLKNVMRSTQNWSKLTSSQCEALEMIQHKIGRILNGDPNYTDNWHDIQGYAYLVEEELKGNVK